MVNFDVLDAKYIIDKLPSNGLVTIEPSVSSAFGAGAASAYGLTPENLLQANGKHHKHPLKFMMATTS